MRMDGRGYEVRDNKDRRTGFDRRRFLYADHIPERRFEQDRRSGLDRRD